MYIQSRIKTTQYTLTTNIYTSDKIYISLLYNFLSTIFCKVYFMTVEYRHSRSQYCSVANYIALKHPDYKMHRSPHKIWLWCHQKPAGGCSHHIQSQTEEVWCIGEGVVGVDTPRYNRINISFNTGPAVTLVLIRGDFMRCRQVSTWTVLLWR